MNSQFIDWESIFLKHKLDKRFVSRIYKKCLQLSYKETKQKQTAKKEKELEYDLQSVLHKKCTQNYKL